MNHPTEALTKAEPLEQVIAVLMPFLGPPLARATEPERFRHTWSPPGPWAQGDA